MDSVLISPFHLISFHNCIYLHRKNLIEDDGVDFQLSVWLLVVGCWLLVVGCRLLVVGCRLSVVGCRLSVVGCRLLIVSCQLSVVGCWLLVVGCRLLVVTGCYSLSDKPTNISALGQPGVKFSLISI